MKVVDTAELKVVEKLPGWRGRYFHTENMTIAHYDFAQGASIHRHFHAQEEVWEVIEGQIEITLDDQVVVLRPGLVGIVPSQTPHSVKALTDGRAIIIDYPIRPEFG